MVHLRSPLQYSPDSFDTAFSQSLTTIALYYSSIEWFETRFRKPISKDLPSSYLQFQILSNLFVAHLDEAAIATGKNPPLTGRDCNF